MRTIRSATIMTSMLMVLLICVCLISATAISAAAENIVTRYQDGALFQQDVVAKKGVIVVQLADGLLKNSLKIVPTPGTSILGVDVQKTARASNSEKELDSLLEQRLRCEDRLKALSTREDIFKTAAKSQSGKTPRKTKTNPDPLQTIRQGTDYAIAQLEAVYTARRRTDKELLKIDRQIAAASKKSGAAGSTLRITVTPARGSVNLRYAYSWGGWQPFYNLHLTGAGSALVQLSARAISNSSGFRTHFSLGALVDSPPAAALVAQSGNSTTLASYKLQLADKKFGNGILNEFSGRITNVGGEYFPPGDMGLFRSGVYIGNIRFEGLSSGRSKVITLAK